MHQREKGPSPSRSATDGPLATFLRDKLNLVQSVTLRKMSEGADKNAIFLSVAIAMKQMRCLLQIIEKCHMERNGLTLDCCPDNARSAVSCDKPSVFHRNSVEYEMVLEGTLFLKRSDPGQCDAILYQFQYWLCFKSFSQWGNIVMIIISLLLVFGSFWKIFWESFGNGNSGNILNTLPETFWERSVVLWLYDIQQGPFCKT